MELNLTFASGIVRGDGKDDIGLFFVRGRYDPANGECHWTKTYVGAHDVFYRGFREGKGIWGTWEIQIFGRGGFHIWPLAAGESAERGEFAEQVASADAVSSREIDQSEEVVIRL